MSAPRPRGAGAGDAAANAQAVESLDTLVHARDGPGEAARQTAPPVRDAGNLVLGRYRILARLGAGGFGVVFSAHDEVLDRPVAVKRIALPAGTSGDRAAREALAAARLAHPAIVSLYEACAAGDTFVLVSELVEGHTLASLIDSGSLSDEETADIGLALCDALAHAHTRGVIHRDVKPQNVLIPDRPDEGGAPAKLADFGGARLAGEETLTRSGDVVGTLAYMAPEQAAAGEAGEEADLYSLALVLFEAFAGENPVRGPTPAATARLLGSRLPSLAARRPAVAEVIPMPARAPVFEQSPTAREIEVLQLVSEGLVNREIGDRLFLSEETVKSHVRHILAKLQARSRAHAVAVGFRRGLLT